MKTLFNLGTYATTDHISWTTDWGAGYYPNLSNSQCTKCASSTYSVANGVQWYSWVSGYYIPGN